MKRWIGILPGLAFLALLVLLWELVARNLGDRAAVFPPPSAIFSTLWTMASGTALWVALGQSLYRLAAGYLLGLAPAMP